MKELKVGDKVIGVFGGGRMHPTKYLVGTVESITKTGRLNIMFEDGHKRQYLKDGWQIGGDNYLKEYTPENIAVMEFQNNCTEYDNTLTDLAGKLKLIKTYPQRVMNNREKLPEATEKLKQCTQLIIEILESTNK